MSLDCLCTTEQIQMLNAVFLELVWNNGVPSSVTVNSRTSC